MNKAFRRRVLSVGGEKKYRSELVRGPIPSSRYDTAVKRQ